ncbi:MAG: amino acid permease [Candidatus Eremiobacteraeota bacterium]|nr:amino acid permease [Candidatus Eremiobacteraeota bacterium]
MGASQPAQLQRRLGLADLTLITIGAVIGSGIFRTPAVVAARAHSSVLITSCWLIGGVIALIGGCIYAELAARRPLDGGAYAYLRDAFNPLIAFLLPWQLLTLSYVGSTALSAVLFADYVLPLTGLQVEPRVIAVLAIAAVTSINLLGVRQGSTWQHILVSLKVVGIGSVIVTGLLLAHPVAAAAPRLSAFTSPLAIAAAIGVAMLPVLFSYNNFQSTAFMTAETKNPAVTIPRGLIVGILAIVAIYFLASFAYLRILGPDALAMTKTPAADVMRVAFGTPGAVIVALAIATSTLGFMSSAVLLAPRVYFQMAYDGLFFKQIAWINPKTKVPAVAIALHGTIAAIYAATGSYELILNWIAAWIWLFSLLCALAVFVFRKRDAGLPRPGFTVPLHPWSTGLFILAILFIFASSYIQYPIDTSLGALINIGGVIFYMIWNRRRAPASA